MKRSPAALRAAYHDLLALVEKPGRYLGGEQGVYRKDPSAGAVRVALAFPDVYEIGQSHLGLQILYDLLNQLPDVAAERVFAPWIDMEAVLRRHHLPLVSLESFTPLDAFHIVGFSLQYELTFTNILTMLELGEIPIAARQRTAGHPLVIAGGPGAFNPEPIAEFIDAFVLGDAEEAIVDICAIVRAWHRRSRQGLLEALAQVPGVYVPAFFAPRYHGDGSLAAIEPLHPGYTMVQKRVLRDLNDSPVPSRPVVPNIDIVHGRPSVEVMRGCVKGCRFCQAGYVYRPQRERDPRHVVTQASRLIDQTGHEELSLLSLSTGDYSCINPVLRDLMNRFAPQQVALSLPSTRVDAISSHVLQELRRGRKAGFTLAPEAGSQRMRDIIQKEYKEEELVDAARLLFGLGWRTLKLYFMLGLPGETDEDLQAIVDLSRKVAAVGPRRTDITASVSTFVPKPHTPFQWAAQIDVTETHARQSLLRRELARHRIRFKWHDARLSFLEGIFSRGDRRLARLVWTAQRLGCRFDGWTEQCRWDLWERAMVECNTDSAAYLRRRHLNEVLPWDHLYSGVTKKYLQQELARAVEGILTPDCSIERCTYCGACDFETVRNTSYHLRGAKGGRHLGADIDAWARAQLPNLPSWATKSWQAAQLRLAARAARTRRNVPPEAMLDPTSCGNPGGATDRAQREAERGDGNAEEWLGTTHTAVQADTHRPAAHQSPRTRVRLCYTKRGPARFIGSRETAEIFYRAARRARIPVAFSRGHHPLPLFSFGPGLPLGIASEAEFADIELVEALAPDVVGERLGRQLPEGMDVVGAWSPPLDGPGISAQLRGFRYMVRLPEPWSDVVQLQKRVTLFRRAPSFSVTRRGKHGAMKTIDVRPAVDLRIRGQGMLEVDVQCTVQGQVPVTAFVAALFELDEPTARRLVITKVETFFVGEHGSGPDVDAPTPAPRLVTPCW